MDISDQHRAQPWRICPALLLAACMGCGIIAADLCPAATSSTWFCFAALNLLLLSCSVWPQHPRPPLSLLRFSATGLLALSLGAAAFQQQHTPAPDDISFLLPEGEHDVSITGRIENRPKSSLNSTRFFLTVRRIGRSPSGRASGRILVVVYDDRGGEISRLPPTLRKGVVVRLRGRFVAVSPRRNPADFDYRRYLFLQGVTHRLNISDSTGIEILGMDRGWPERLTDRIRTRTASQIAAHLSGPRARTLTQALLLGDRDSIDTDVRSDFRRTGLTHLLAVSGLHMMLVGLALYGLLGPLLTRVGLAWRAREVARFSVTTLVLAGYALLTGASPSATRAAVMAVVLLGGNLLQRTSHPLNSLGVAALVLLGAHPADLYDLGFQLSFAAVGGLVLLHPVFIHPFTLCRRSVRKAVAALSVSLAATFATAPILLYNFGYVSLAGLFLNLVAVPLTSILMISGLATVFAAVMSVTLANSFGAACGALAHVLLLLANAGSESFSWASVRGQFFTGWEVAAMAALLCTIAAVRFHRLRWRLACCTLALVAAGAWSGVLSGDAASNLDVIFFDVGQGDAALILTPNRHAFLVDTGPGGDWGDAGAQTILPHLRRNGIRQLDAVVITHPHLDHIGGLASILSSIPVHRVIHTVENNVSRLHPFALIDSLQIPVQRVYAGDTLCIDPALRIGVLSPDRSTAVGRDVNEASVVLRVAYGRTTFLLLGDADADAEYLMAARYGSLLRSDVVKVGHHGSSTSSSPMFVARVRPDSTPPAFAVVSVARHNPYDLPDSTVLARWRRSGALVLTTSLEGAVWLESDGRHVWRKRWRQVGVYESAKVR